MILFFKPREIIEFLKENKEENKKLEEKLGIGFVSTITSSYDKAFFEKFSTRGDFIFITLSFGKIKIGIFFC